MNLLRPGRKRDLILGILAGMLVPFVGYAILLMANERITESFTKSLPQGEMFLDKETMFLLAICMNLLPFHYFNKNQRGTAMRGVLLVTMLAAFFWTFLYFKEGTPGP